MTPSNSPTPTTAAIIPTCNRPNELAACLECLRHQGLDEIVLCDDAGGAQSLAERILPTAKVVRGPGLGPGPNRNAGAASASAEWLLFLDDDCLAWPGWADAYRNAITTLSPGVQRILAGPTTPTGPGSDSLLREAPKFSGGPGLPPSCNFAIPAADFRRSGGFDPRYRTSFEDMEFFARLSASGSWIVFVEGAGVDHPRRDIPSPSRLASRWEARVTSSLDWGGHPNRLYLPILRHVALVILSRFRGRGIQAKDIPAALAFGTELMLVALQLPRWLSEKAREPRSAFWSGPDGRAARPPRCGL